ncbi:MAG: hypothetical protein NZ890_03145 [Myxococcota bacterium]|nr:hypothetical protein [Myxococcota bacterium]
MRRSVLIQVAVFCPHLRRPVAVLRNEVIGRLVHCEDKPCRQTTAQGQDPTPAPFPAGCPVYPTLSGSR